MKLVLMSTITDKIIPAFGWMLIHSLWEGLLFSIITGAVLILTKRFKAELRYNLVLVLFAGFICTCTFTFIHEWNSTTFRHLKSLMPASDSTIVPSLFSTNLL